MRAKRRLWPCWYQILLFLTQWWLYLHPPPKDRYSVSHWDLHWAWPLHIENMLDNEPGPASGAKSRRLIEEIPHEAELDGNLISNLGDKAIGSTRLCFDQMWQAKIWSTTPAQQDQPSLQSRLTTLDKVPENVIECISWGWQTGLRLWTDNLDHLPDLTGLMCHVLPHFQKYWKRYGLQVKSNFTEVWRCLFAF